MKILTVVGARPQFVKAAAVSRALRARHREVLLHTGQHYDDAMSDQFFRELQIPAPDITLNVGSLPHGPQTAQMLVGVEQAIAEHAPDRVLVYGDTNSTLAGALAAAKAVVPLAHVEAGLRSFNRRMPEEINRVVTDHLADVLFCPSRSAADNLAREGIASGVHVVGDVMAESLRLFLPPADRAASMLAARGVGADEYFLATIHRAENTDDHDRLRRIVRAFGELGAPVVFPAHPRVREALERAGITLAPSVRVIDPVGYPEMLALVRGSRAVLTDSGGLQKEAYWIGVPCVTLRHETEWIETVDAGWNRLAGTDTARIVGAVRSLTTPSTRPPLYGEGEAVERIVDVLSSPSARAVPA